MGGSEDRRVSMADVAAAAGVSGQTVSRVANGSARVDPATRARVEEAMAALGYRPHRAARALRTGRTQAVGLVATTFATTGNARLLQAIADAAASRGYAVVVAALGADEPIDTAFERLRDQGVDGAIVLNEATSLVRASSDPAGVQLVVIDSPPDDRFSIVQADHARGAALATAHLLELGHRTVHHVAGPADSFAARERERGWRSALDAAGATVREPLRGDWSSASGFAAGNDLDEHATAVFAANDQMTLGAMRALADRGRALPADVSVVGFDDVADAGEYQPPLTTVRQPFDVVGERALELLIAQIGGAARSSERIDVELIVRASTARAR